RAFHQTTNRLSAHHLSDGAIAAAFGCSRGTCISPPGGVEGVEEGRIRFWTHHGLDRSYARDLSVAHSPGANRARRGRPDPLGLHPCTRRPLHRCLLVLPICEVRLDARIAGLTG